MKILLLLTLTLSLLSCEELNIKPLPPSAQSETEYKLQYDFSSFIANTLAHLNNFVTKQEFELYIEDNSARFQNLDNYDAKIDYLRMRFENHQSVQGN